MNGSDVFHEAFSKHWFEWKEKNRKAIKFVKVPENVGKFGDDVSNTHVLVVDLKKNKYKTEIISYYKLFNNCTIVEDGDTLKKLLVLEAKLRLLA